MHVSWYLCALYSTIQSYLSLLTIFQPFPLFCASVFLIFLLLTHPSSQPLQLSTRSWPSSYLSTTYVYLKRCATILRLLLDSPKKYVFIKGCPENRKTVYWIPGLRTFWTSQIKWNVFEKYEGHRSGVLRTTKTKKKIVYAAIRCYVKTKQ